MTCRLYGKPSREQLDELDSLLVELRRTNQHLLGDGKVIPLGGIKPLDPDKNGRLWEYIRHYCRMVVMWPNHLKAVKAICGKDDRMDSDEAIEEVVSDMSIHVYRYVWRRYRHCDDAGGYIVGTAKFGFKEWLAKQNARIELGNDIRDAFSRWWSSNHTHKTSRYDVDGS